MCAGAFWPLTGPLRPRRKSGSGPRGACAARTANFFIYQIPFENPTFLPISENSLSPNPKWVPATFGEFWARPRNFFTPNLAIFKISHFQPPISRQPITARPRSTPHKMRASLLFHLVPPPTHFRASLKSYSPKTQTLKNRKFKNFLEYQKF